MQKMTKEELTEFVNKVSGEVSGVYTDVSNTGNVNMDAVNMLARNMVQIQRNCMNILVETLYRLMEMGKM